MGDFAIGSEVAGYRIDALLARGGMGVVYRATHLGLERPVALKVIARELADREGFRERFLRESRLAARLDHPAVVPIYDSREVDGELIVAMRFVSGGDLRRLLDREGPLEPHRALDLLGQVAEALDAAHAAGIVHRDVKPHNILIEGERAYLSDFGLAKALGDSAALSGASVVGTAEYMSPEQWQGARVGAAADVYSLGCVLYEALTGIAPFARRESEAEVELPQGLEEVIERAVAKEPERRHPSAGALIAAARERQSGELEATKVLSRGPSERTTEPLGRPPRRARSFLRPGRTSASAGGLGRRNLGLVVAGLALVAVIVVAVLALAGGGDGADVSQPIAVGKPPLRIAAGDEGVWVTSAGDGSLIRLDPESGEPIGEPLRIGGASGVALGEGSVWVTVPSRGELVRVDPGEDEVTQRISLGEHPGPIAFGGGRVWVADERGAGVTAVNARGGKVFKRGIAPQQEPLRLAVGAGGLWVSSASTGSLRRIDLSSGRAEKPVLVGRGPTGVTVASGLVWVANSRAGSVTTVEASTRSLIGDPIEVGTRPGGIDAGTTTVWLADTGDNAVERIEIASRQRLGAPIEVGPEPGAVAVGEDAVWVGNNGDGTVTRIEP